MYTEIYTDNEKLLIDLDSPEDLCKALEFKVKNIKAKADPSLFEAILKYFIVWHPIIGDLKPQADKFYLVSVSYSEESTYSCFNTVFVTVSQPVLTEAGTYIWKVEQDIPKTCVKAWAELPDPYEGQGSLSGSKFLAEVWAKSWMHKEDKGKELGA